MDNAGEARDLYGFTRDTDGMLLENGGTERSRFALERDELPSVFGWRDKRVGAHVAPPTVGIGKRARYLADQSESRTHIAGSTISNDASQRAFQLEESGGQWSKGKSCETFNPLGPYLVPAGDLDYSRSQPHSSVNGEAQPDSSANAPIFSVDYLVWHLSQYMTLESRDVVNTGTPQGVALSARFPSLRSGDVMPTSVDQLGEQTQQLVNSVKA